MGSYAELKELSGALLDDYHRPWVDNIEFDLDGVHYKRIEKVLDCWFESGSMPFAQFHYPFENKDKFEANFPGDFIVEYVGQVRAWFYYVHAVNVGLFGRNAFKNVVVTGNLMGSDGFKLSKSRGNYTDPSVVIDTYSVDAWRFLLLSCPVAKGEDFTLKDKEVQDVQRKLAMIWNMYDFFTLYASVDGWEWGGSLDDPSADLTNPLDIWVLSKLHQLQEHIGEKMDAYDIPGALEPVLAFVDDASNWYVRRSRRRFWKSGDDTDKTQAYHTLHYLLVRLSIILAPFVPFLAEELFLQLTGGEAGESVHLLDWPEAGAVDETILREMTEVRLGVEQGLSQRAAHKIKVRQPLQSANVLMSKLPESSERAWHYNQIIKEELNVKDASVGEMLSERVEGVAYETTMLDFEVTPELKREGIMREVVRQVQEARKQAGLQVDDRIRLVLDTADSEVKQAIVEYAETIKTETLAVSLNKDAVSGYKTDAKVEGTVLIVSLEKAAR